MLDRRNSWEAVERIKTAPWMSSGHHVVTQEESLLLRRLSHPQDLFGQDYLDLFVPGLDL